MLDLFSGSVAWHETMAIVLLHFLWQGCAVALLVEFAVRALRLKSGAPRYAAYLMGFATLAACPLLTLVYLAGGVEQVASPSLLTPAITEQPLHWSAQLAAAIRPHSAWITAVWFAGVGCLSLRFVCGVWTLHRIRTQVQSVPAELAEQARAIAERLGVRAMWTLGCSETAREPMTFGWLRPVVLLPAALLARQSPAILEAVLAHELAHIRRYDLWVNALQRLVESLLFFHPVVWWMSKRVREEREICCDDIAVQMTGEPLVYATALERVASHRVEQYTAPLAVAMSGGSLQYRVRRALGLADPVVRSTVPSPRVLLMAALLCGTLVLTGRGGTQWLGQQFGKGPDVEPEVATTAIAEGEPTLSEELPSAEASTEEHRGEEAFVQKDNLDENKVNKVASNTTKQQVAPPMDAQPTQVVTVKEPAYISFDSNGDGTLDEAERNQIEKAYAAKAKDRTKKMLEKYDTNRDGKLDFREKAAAWTSYHRSRRSRHRGPRHADSDRRADHDRRPSDRKPRHGHRSSDWKKKLIAKYDANGDGSLDKSERSTMYSDWKQHRAKQWKAYIERYDIDGDGRLDEHEKMAIHLARTGASKTDRRYPGST